MPAFTQAVQRHWAHQGLPRAGQQRFRPNRRHHYWSTARRWASP